MSTRVLERWEGSGFAWAQLAVTASALAVGALAVVSPIRALGLAAGLIFVAVTLRSLAAGVALFTFLIFLDQIPAVASAGFSVVKLAGAFLVFTWLITMANRSGGAPVLLRRHPATAFALVFFFLWAMLSSLWAVDGHAALSASGRLGQNILLYFVVYSAVRERRHLRWVVGAYIAGAFMTAAVGLAQGVSPDTAGASAGRLVGGLLDPNYLAAALVPAIIFAAFMLGAVREPLLRWLLVAAVGVFAVALFLTQSRGGVVALGVTFVVIPLLAGPLRARATSIILVVTSLAVGYFALIAPPQALGHLSNFSAGGGSGRTDLWSIALNMAGHHLVNGVGADNFVQVEPHYVLGNISLSQLDQIIDKPHVAHNTYLDILSTLGVVGLVAFVVFVVASLVFVVRAARMFARAHDRELETLTRGILIGTIGLLVAYVFLTAQYEKQLWIVLGLCAASLSVARLTTRAPAPVAEPVRIELPQALPPPPATAEVPTYDRDVSDRDLERRERRVAVQSAAIREERVRLEAQIAALTEREQEFAARIAAVEDAEARRAAVEADLDQREAAAAARERELTLVRRPAGDRDAALAERASAVEQREAGEALRAELEERERAVAEHLAALERRTNDLSAREQQLAEERRRLEAVAATLAEREAAVAASEAAVVRPPDSAQPPAAVQEPPASAPAQVSPSSPPAQTPPEAASYRWRLGTLERLVDEYAPSFPDRAAEWRAFLVYLRGLADSEGILPASVDVPVREALGELIEHARRS